MKRKHFFAMTLAICLTTIIVVAAVVPAFAASNHDLASSKGKTNRGTVEINLAPGGGALANRPTDLVLLAYDYDNSMNYADVLVVTKWIQSMNSFVPVAVIGDQAPNAQIKALWNSTTVYLEINGSVIRNNLITVSDHQLEVWTEPKRSMNWYNFEEDIVLMVNLTVAAQLDFTGLPSAVFGSAFSVPAMSIMFRGIGESFAHEETMTFPNGYMIKSTHSDIPAWVRFSIPAWGYSPTVSGTLIYHDTSTITPPA